MMLLGSETASRLQAQASSKGIKAVVQLKHVGGRHQVGTDLILQGLPDECLLFGLSLGHVKHWLALQRTHLWMPTMHIPCSHNTYS